jgi:hypothetical protein
MVIHQKPLKGVWISRNAMNGNMKENMKERKHEIENMKERNLQM